LHLLGIGAGIGAGIFAQIARTTTEKERTGMFSIAMGLRQFGLLVGMSIWWDVNGAELFAYNKPLLS